MMTKPLTKRQAEIRDWILNFQSQKGYAPSYQEIGAGVGLSSLATIHRHVHTLKRKGAITFSAGHSRSIQVREAAGAHVTCPHCHQGFAIAGELQEY